MTANDCDAKADEAAQAAERLAGMEKLNMLRVAAQWRAMANQRRGSLGAGASAPPPRSS